MGLTTYVYSSEGRLLQVDTPDQTISYRHNALGHRVAKLINGQVVEQYLWQDLTTLLAVYDGQGNLKQRFEYTLGHTPSSFTQNGQRYFIQTDHLGSPRVITDYSGNVIKVINYDSYGNITQDINPEFEIPFGFAGGLKDDDIGLIRFGYRDYDPETGRWTARDPIGFEGGDTNLYGYILGDPVNFIDSSGLRGISSNTSIQRPWNSNMRIKEIYPLSPNARAIDHALQRLDTVDKICMWGQCIPDPTPKCKITTCDIQFIPMDNTNYCPKPVALKPIGPKMVSKDTKCYCLD